MPIHFSGLTTAAGVHTDCNAHLAMYSNAAQSSPYTIEKKCSYTAVAVINTVIRQPRVCVSSSCTAAFLLDSEIALCCCVAYGECYGGFLMA
jgi:hypothetical protein